MTRRLPHVGLALMAGAAMAIIQIVAVQSSAFPYLWVLPATFIAATTMTLTTGRKPEGFPWLEYGLVVLWFVRLVVIPSLMVTAGASYFNIGPVPNAKEYQQGVIYMAYEVLITGLVVVLIQSNLARRSDRDTSKRRAASPSPGRDISFRLGSYVPQSLLIAGGGALLIFASVRERFSFFTTAITGTAREIASGYDASFSSLASLANLARFAVPGLLIALALRAYRRRPSMVYPLLAVCGSVGVNLFYVATSRASFFVPLAASIIVLAMAFPSGRLVVLVLAGSALVVATIVVTQNKSFSTSAQSSLGDMANYLSTYLMGPKEYAIGVRAVHDYGALANGTTLFGDFLGNIPFVSNVVDPLNRTSQFYNWSYRGVSRGVGGGYIAPASIQSAFYVGWALGPFSTAFGLIPAALGLRYLRKREQDPSLSYVAAFALVTALLFHTNTFSTMASFVAFPIVPLIAIAKLDTWIARSTRKEERRHERYSYRPS